MTVIKYQTKSIVPELPGLEINTMLICENEIIIHARGAATEGICPSCLVGSCSVHSRYVRCPQDLPCSGKAVRLRITVKRFRCNNSECTRKTFAEPLPELIAYRSQRTNRCAQIQYLLALGLGGECGSRILGQLGMSISGDTLLRMIRDIEMPECETPRLLGVDDWAWRKGTRYGTILCDLEKRQIIEILPDRDQKTFADWLKKHPGIEVITRDRAKHYGEGATMGAPDAQQIADRWHLLRNMRDKLHIQLRHHKELLRWTPSVPIPDPNTEPLITGSKIEQKRIQNHRKKVEQHQQIHAMYQQRHSVHDIASALGISSRTVYRWLDRPFVEERRRNLPQERQLAPYADYIQQRFQDGIASYRGLFRELQALGYDGNHETVRQAIKRLEKGLTMFRARPNKSPKQKRLTPSKAVWLFVLERDKLHEKQLPLLDRILNIPLLNELYMLVQRFCNMVRNREPDGLLEWIGDASNSNFTEMVSFAHGLQQDLSAVQAGLTFEWSNGPVEGHVNRLKLVKRQMYGRASFALLRARLLNPV